MSWRSTWWEPCKMLARWSPILNFKKESKCLALWTTSCQTEARYCTCLVGLIWNVNVTDLQINHNKCCKDMYTGKELTIGGVWLYVWCCLTVSWCCSNSGLCACALSVHWCLCGLMAHRRLYLGTCRSYFLIRLGTYTCCLRGKPLVHDMHS